MTDNKKDKQIDEFIKSSEEHTFNHQFDDKKKPEFQEQKISFKENVKSRLESLLFHLIIVFAVLLLLGSVVYTFWGKKDAIDDNAIEVKSNNVLLNPMQEHYNEDFNFSNEANLEPEETTITTVQDESFDRLAQLRAQQAALQQQLEQQRQQLLIARRQSPILIKAQSNDESKLLEDNAFSVPVSMAQNQGDRTFKINQGKLIDAILVSGINSDHPGQIIAQTTEHVYGEEGRAILIPKGTRLFGQYMSDIQRGQTSIQAVWDRAITPTGLSIHLGSNATSGQGLTGVYGGKINNHYTQNFGVGILVSLLGAGASLVDVNNEDQNNSKANYRNAVQESMANQASDIVGKQGKLEPTITLNAGQRIKVLVAKDLDFSNILNDY